MCLRVSIAIIKRHDQKQLKKEKVCFFFQLVVCHPGKAGWGLKAEVEAGFEAGCGGKYMEKCSLLTFSPCLVQSASFLYTPGPSAQEWCHQ